MADEHTFPYVNQMNVQFGPLEVVEEGVLSGNCKHQWFNQTLCEVNDTWIRLGVCQGEYHWHEHMDTDEFFYVVEGKWLIDLEGRTVQLGPRQAFVIPKGVKHRPRAPVRTVILMAEKKGVVPTGTLARSFRPSSAWNVDRAARSGHLRVYRRRAPSKLPTCDFRLCQKYRTEASVRQAKLAP